MVFEEQLFNLYQNSTLFVTLIIILMVWTTIWKGIGLWFAGKNQQKIWFIFMLIFNIAGLLPIAYLLWGRPKQVVKEKQKVKKKQAKEVEIDMNDELEEKVIKKKSARKKAVKKKE